MTINFLGSVPPSTCDNVSLSSPSFALSSPSCYEIDLWEDANWTDFTPSVQSPADCGTISYTLVYNDQGAVNDMTQFSVVNDALVGHPDFDLFLPTSPHVSEIEFEVYVKATLDVDGAKEYAWSTAICVKVTNPCATTNMQTTPISETFFVYQGIPETFDISDNGLPWPDSADLDTSADGTGKCGPSDYTLTDANGDPVSWATLRIGSRRLSGLPGRELHTQHYY